MIQQYPTLNRFSRALLKYALAGSLIAASAIGAAKSGGDPLISLSGTKEIRIGAPVKTQIVQYSLEELSSANEDGDTSSCGTTTYSYPPLDVDILATSGKIRRLRIEAQYDNVPEISYRTPEGIRLGSTLADVRRRYPNAEETVEQNGGRTQIYAWRQLNRSGYLFEVSPESQRVVALAVGDETLRWYEGCV